MAVIHGFIFVVVFSADKVCVTLYPCNLEKSSLYITFLSQSSHYVTWKLRMQIYKVCFFI